jgi:hypothetical protein
MCRWRADRDDDEPPGAGTAGGDVGTAVTAAVGMRRSGVADSVQDFGPPYIKGFFVVLPDAIPVADRSSWTFITDELEPELDGVGVRAFPNLPPFGVGKPGRNFVGIRFHQIRDDALSPLEADHRILNLAVDRIHRPGEAPEPGPAPIGLQRYRSVAELATFVADVADLVTTPTKPDPLTRCLAKLFGFHAAYRVLAELSCEELTYKRLHPLVITTRRKLDEDGATVDGLMMLDLRPDQIGALTEQIGSVNFGNVTDALARRLAGDPIFAYLERLTQARHAFDQLGKNSEAVTHIATACEVLLGGLLGMALWEVGTSAEDAAVTFSQDLASRVKREYAKLLGGQWSLATGAVGDWYDEVGGLRNRVVHAAYQPSDAEVAEAFAAAARLAGHIADRLHYRFRTFPATAWVFLGAPGFESRGGITKSAQKWLDSQAGEVKSHIKAYRDWRAEVNNSVQRRRIST